MHDLTNHAGEIRRHHEAVKRAARTAMTHALAAGALLSQVREKLPHGEFGKWLAANVEFTDRTARRYMQLHAHRDSLPPGANVKTALAMLKSDTVSEMELPDWIPPHGDAAIAFGPHDRYWIIWLDDDQRYAHALFLDMHPTAANADGMKRPIAISHFPDQLRYMELEQPETADWNPIPLAEALKFRKMVFA